MHTHNLIRRARIHRSYLWLLPRRKRMKLSRSLECSAAVLHALSHDRSDFIRRSVAWNPNAAEATLVRLAGPKQPHIARLSVAGLSHAPHKALQMLANDHHCAIRAAVAANRRTPEHILEELAEDAGVSVRHDVAANRRTPRNVRQRLAEDTCELVRIGAVSNPKADPGTLAVLQQDPCGLIAELASSHKKARDR